MNNKMLLTPCVCVSHDDQNGRLNIELELPGGKKTEIVCETGRVDFLLPVKALSG